MTDDAPAGRRHWLSACAPKTGAGAGRDGAEVSRFHAARRCRRRWPARRRPTSSARGWAFLQAGDFEDGRARVCRGVESGAGVLPGGDVARLHRARAQGREGGAAAFRPRAGAQPAARTMSSTLLGRGQALLALNREAEALAAFEAALAADPSLTDLPRRVEVLRFRSVEQGLARGARRRRAPAGSTKRPRRTRRRSPARPTARSCIASWRASNGRRANADAALEHFRKAAALDPADASRSRRSAKSSTRVAISKAPPRRMPTRWRSSRTPMLQKRLDAVRARAGAGAAAGGVPRHRSGAADHARAISRR